MHFRKLLSRWKQYRYRFVPWIILNLKERSLRSVAKGEHDKVATDEEVKETLVKLFTSLAAAASDHGCSENVYEVMMKQQYGCKDIFTRNLEVMLCSLGYSIRRKTSTVADGGTGVFVQNGTVKQGSVVALYPGTIYHADEPILIQSIRNPFIFRCIDSLLIDGNDKGISKFIFRSCGQRDRHGAHFICDMSWLTAFPSNPMAVGQYINNHNKRNAANVAYQEYDIPDDFPFQFRQFIPNIYYSVPHESCQNRLTRTVVLIALRDIEEGEELFSNYFTVVH